MQIDDEYDSVTRELSQIRHQLVKITTLLTGILVTVIILCGVALVPMPGPQSTLEAGVGAFILIFGICIPAMRGGGIAGLAAAVINRRTALAQQEERMRAPLLEVEAAANTPGDRPVTN